MSYNIWAAAKTRNGLAADEVISTLQKSIRRNKVEEACLLMNYISQDLCF